MMGMILYTNEKNTTIDKSEKNKDLILGRKNDPSNNIPMHAMRANTIDNAFSSNKLSSSKERLFNGTVGNSNLNRIIGNKNNEKIRIPQFQKEEVAPFSSKSSSLGDINIPEFD